MSEKIGVRWLAILRPSVPSEVKITAVRQCPIEGSRSDASNSASRCHLCVKVPHVSGYVSVSGCRR